MEVEICEEALIHKDKAKLKVEKVETRWDADITDTVDVKMKWILTFQNTCGELSYFEIVLNDQSKQKFITETLQGFVKPV